MRPVDQTPPHAGSHQAQLGFDSPSASSPRRRRILALSAVGLAVVALAACSHDGRSMRTPKPDQNLSIITAPPETTVAAGDVAGALPSLPLADTAAATAASTAALDTEPTTTTAPAAIDSGPVTGFAVTAPWTDGGVIDARYTCTGDNVAPALQWANVPSDAVELAVVVVDPDAENFVHWVVAGIAPGVTALAEGQLPAGAVQGLNGFGTLGWSGPCPPAGESHTYRFEVHALSKASGLTDGAVGDGMLRVIDGDTLESALTIGVFPGS